MLHQPSAAFKGADIQSFWEGGRSLYGENKHIYGRLDNTLVTMINVIKQKMFQQIVSKLTFQFHPIPRQFLRVSRVVVGAML